MHTASQLPRCQMPTKGMHKRLVSRPLIGRSLETGKSTGAEQVLLGRLCVCHWSGSGREGKQNHRAAHRHSYEGVRIREEILIPEAHDQPSYSVPQAVSSSLTLEFVPDVSETVHDLINLWPGQSRLRLKRLRIYCFLYETGSWIPFRLPPAINWVEFTRIKSNTSTLYQYTLPLTNHSPSRRSCSFRNVTPAEGRSFCIASVPPQMLRLNEPDISASVGMSFRARVADLNLDVSGSSRTFLTVHSTVPRIVRSLAFSP